MYSTYSTTQIIHISKQRYYSTFLHTQNNCPSKSKYLTIDTTRDTLLGGALALVPEFENMIWPKNCFQSLASTSSDQLSTIDQAPTNQQPPTTSTTPLDNGVPPKSKCQARTSVSHLHSFFRRAALLPCVLF